MMTQTMTRQELPGSLYDPATGSEIPDSASVGGMRPPETAALLWQGESGDKPPKPIALEFRYSHWPQLPGLRWLIGWPGRSLLPALASADSPAKVRTFAAKWGRLGTCEHYPSQPLEQSSGTGFRVFVECMACWEAERDWARTFMERLSTAGAKRGKEADDAPERARRELLDQLNAASLGVLTAPVALSDGWRDGALHTRVAWATVPGLHGYVVIAALGMFAQAGGSALPAFCSGCGVLFTPEHRVRRNRATYCPECADRARWRKASQGFRDRREAAKAAGAVAKPREKKR